MQRIFTKDHGRYRAGEVKDFPIFTWRSFFPGYEKFTRPVSEIAEESVRSGGADARIVRRGGRNRR